MIDGGSEILREIDSNRFFLNGKKGTKRKGASARSSASTPNEPEGDTTGKKRLARGLKGKSRNTKRSTTPVGPRKSNRKLPAPVLHPKGEILNTAELGRRTSREKAPKGLVISRLPDYPKVG